jgi:hypothetical protein
LTYKGKGVLTTYWCEPIARSEKESLVISLHTEQETGDDTMGTLYA